MRIGSCFAEPTSVRMLSVWMSPADGARLFHAALTAEDVGHTVVYGSSANTRLWWDLTTARALGYEPQDDSEPYAEKLIAEQGELDPDNPDHAHLGGHFVTRPADLAVLTRPGRCTRAERSRPAQGRAGTERARPLPCSGTAPCPIPLPHPLRPRSAAGGHGRRTGTPGQHRARNRPGQCADTRCRTSPKGPPGPNGQCATEREEAGDGDDGR